MRILNGFGKLVATKQEVFHEPVIQTTTPINPGNNGEPLVDSDDRVDGIHSTALMDAQSISFVIPINIVKFFITELQTHGRIIRPGQSIELGIVKDDEYQTKLVTLDERPTPPSLPQRHNIEAPPVVPQRLDFVPFRPA